MQSTPLTNPSDSISPISNGVCAQYCGERPRRWCSTPTNAGEVASESAVASEAAAALDTAGTGTVAASGSGSRLAFTIEANDFAPQADIRKNRERKEKCGVSFG